MRYAVPLFDLDAAWRTLSGSALVEAAVEDQECDDAELVSVEGADAVVLNGPAPRVAAVVSGLVGMRLPAPLARPVRVYAESPGGWRPVAVPPPIPALPDDSPVFTDEDRP